MLTFICYDLANMLSRSKTFCYNKTHHFSPGNHLYLYILNLRRITTSKFPIYTAGSLFKVSQYGRMVDFSRIIVHYKPIKFQVFSIKGEWTKHGSLALVCVAGNNMYMTCTTKILNRSALILSLFNYTKLCKLI